MNPGVLILVLALFAAAGFGIYRRRTDGQFAVRANPKAEEVAEMSYDETPAWAAVLAAVPTAELGERVTFVQFSSAFCAPCRTTRALLADVASSHDGVVHVEIDAEDHLDLVRTLDVRRTPTTLVFDHAGREISRATGAPRREQVLDVIPALESIR